jgi:hypothetical protein
VWQDQGLLQMKEITEITKGQVREINEYEPGLL